MIDTSQNSADGSLQLNDPRYAEFVRNAPIGIYFTTPEGHIVEANTAMAQMLGYESAEALTSLNAKDFYVQPEDREKWQARIEQDGVVLSFDIQNRLPDGSIIWLRNTARAVRDAIGRVVHYEGTLEDVTRLKETEIHVRQQRDFLDAVVETASEGIAVSDENGNFMLYNRRLAEITGYSKKEIHYNRFPTVLFKDHQSRVRFFKAIEKAFRDGEVISEEWQIVRKDGTKRYVLISLRSFLFTEQRLLIAIVRDITEREEANHRIVQAATRTASLIRVAARLNAQLDLEAVLKAVCEEATRAVDVPAASLFLYEPTSDEMVLAATHGLSPQYVTQHPPRPLALNAYREYTRQKKPVIVTYDAQAVSDPAYRKLFVKHNIRTVVTTSLIRDEVLVGALNIYTMDDVRQFGDNELKLLRGVADQAAQAVTAARLLDAERRTATELARSNGLITTLANIATCIETQSSLDGVLQALGNGLKSIGINCALSILDSDIEKPGAHYTYCSVDQSLIRKSEEVLGASLQEIITAWLQEHQSVDTGDSAFFPNALKAVASFLPKLEQTIVQSASELLDIGLHKPAILTPLMAEESLRGILIVWGTKLRSADLPAFSVFSAQVAGILERTRLLEEVRIGRERLQILSKKLVEVQEKERRHLARELHDEIGQSLTGLKLMLQMATQTSDEPVRGKWLAAQQLVTNLMDQVHDMSLDLRPPILDDMGLMPALLWLIERYMTQTGIEVKFEVFGLDQRLPTEVETAVYRIIQEALTNVARHSEASEAIVRLRLVDRTLRLQVQDTGIGFEPDVLLFSQTIGLTSIQERAKLLGGSVQIDAAKNSGVQITASIPI